MKTLTRSTSSIPSDRRAPCHSHDNDDDIKMFTSTCILYILYTALSRESVCSREEVTVTLRQKSQQEEGGREQIAPPYLISGWVNALRNPRAKIVLNG